METLLEVQKAHYAPRHGPPMLLHETESNPLQRKSKKRKRRKLLVKNHVFIPNTTTTNNNNNKTTNKSKDATLPPSDLPASDLPEGFPPELAFRALAAYSLIRTLSRELRLSPFSPNVFLRALYLPYPNTLLGQIHCCFLRFLLSNLNMGYHYKNRGNGIPETILKKRRLDGIRWPLKAGDNLTFLDNFSWPLFFDDYVHLTADVLYASLTDEDNHVNFANIGMPDTTDMIMEEDLIEKEEEESLMAPAKFGNRSIIMPVVDSLSRSSRSSRRGGIPYSTMDESDEESHQDDFVEDEEEEEDDVYLTPSRSRKSKKRGRPAKNRPLPCNPPAKQTRKLPTSRSIKSRKIGSVLPTSRNRKSILPLHQKGSQGKRKIPTVDKCEVSRPPTKRVTASPLAGSKVQWVEGPQLELDVLAQNDRSQSAPPKARKPQGAQLTSTQKSISAVFRPSGPPAARTLSNPANGFSRDQVGSTNRQLSDRHGVSNDVANVLHNFIAGKLGKSDKKSEALTAIGDSIISKAVHDAPVVVAAAVSSANETVTAHESDFASGQSVVVASAPRSSSQPPDSAPNIPVDVKDNSHSAFKTETLVDSSLATETVKPRSTVAIGCVTSGGNEPLTDLEEATVVRAKTENAAETDVVMSEAAKTSCEGSSGNAAIVSKSALDPGVLVTGFAAVSAKDKPVGGAPVIDGTLLHTKDSDLTQQLLKRKPDDDPFSTGLQAMSSTADGVMRAGPVKENSARPMRSSSNTEITKVSERYSTGSKHRDRADAARPMLSAENCISSHCTMENSGETAESHVLLADSSSVDFLKMDLSCSNRQASIELLPSKEVAPSGNSTEGDDTPKKDGSQLIVLAEDKNTDDQTVASEASFDNTVFVDDRASWPQFEPLKSMRSGIPYHRLDLKEKLVMLEFLIDELLTADTFAAEFSRRDLSTYSDAPYGALPSKEELDDLENADECGICKGEGELLCCDGCTSSYHKGCIDMKPYEELPDGRWLCPECELIDPANYGSLWGGRKSSLDWFTVEDVKTAMQQKNHETMLSESTGVDNTAGSTHVGDATLSTTTSLVYNLEAATTGEGLAGKEATTPTSLSYQLHNPIIGPLQITGSKAGSVTQETSASVPVDVTSAQTLDQVALNRSSESSLQKVQNSSGVAALLQPSLILDSAATTEASTAPGISAILNNLGSSAARVVPAIATSNSDLCKVAPQENPTKDAAMNDDTSTPKPHGKIPDHELLAIHGFVFAREPQSKRGTKCPLAKEDLRKMLIAIGPEMSVSWPLAQIPFSSFEAARTPNHPNPLSLEARAMFDPSSYTNKYRSVPLPKGVFPGIGFQNISLVLSSYEKECCRPDTKYLSNKLSPCMMIDGNLVKSLKAERNLFDPYQMIRDYLLKVEGFLNRAHLLHECWGTLNKEFKTDVWQTNVRKCCSVPRLARLVLKLVDATHERAFLEDWHLVVGGKDLEKLHHESGTDKVAFYPLCDDWTSGAEIKKYQWQNCSLSDIRGLLQSSGQDVSSWVYGQRNAVRATMSKRKRKQTLAERQRPSDAKKMVPQKQANMHLESFNREDMGRTSEVSFSKVAGATLSSVQQLQKAIEVRVGAGIADVSNENSSTVCGFRLSVPGSKEMNGGSSGQGRSDQGTRSDIPEVAETVITASDAGISEVQSDVIRLKQSGQWPQISASITIPEVAGLAVAPSTGTVESLVNGNKKEPTNTPQLGVAGTADAQGDEGKTNPSVPGNTATSNMPSVQTPPKKAESGVSSDVPTDISIETSPAENNAEDESKHKKRKRRKESTSATKSARSRRSGRLQTRQETPEDFIASVIADTGKAHKDLSMETIIEAQKMAKLVEIKELCSMPVLSAQTWPVAGRMLFEPVGSLSSAEMKRLGKRAGKVGAQNVRYAGNFEVGVVSQFHVWRKKLRECTCFEELVLLIRTLESQLDKPTITQCEALARRPPSVRAQLTKEIRCSGKNASTGITHFFLVQKNRNRGAWVSSLAIELSPFMAMRTERREMRLKVFEEKLRMKRIADARATEALKRKAEAQRAARQKFLLEQQNAARAAAAEEKKRKNDMIRAQLEAAQKAGQSKLSQVLMNHKVATEKLIRASSAAGHVQVPLDQMQQARLQTAQQLKACFPGIEMKQEIIFTHIGKAEAAALANETDRKRKEQERHLQNVATSTHNSSQQWPQKPQQLAPPQQRATSNRMAMGNKQQFQNAGPTSLVVNSSQQHRQIHQIHQESGRAPMQQSQMQFLAPGRSRNPVGNGGNYAPRPDRLYNQSINSLNQQHVLNQNADTQRQTLAASSQADPALLQNQLFQAAMQARSNVHRTGGQNIPSHSQAPSNIQSHPQLSRNMHGWYQQDGVLVGGNGTAPSAPSSQTIIRKDNFSPRQGYQNAASSSRPVYLQYSNNNNNNNPSMLAGQPYVQPPGGRGDGMEEDGSLDVLFDLEPTPINEMTHPNPFPQQNATQGFPQQFHQQPPHQPPQQEQQHQWFQR